MKKLIVVTVIVAALAVSMVGCGKASADFTNTPHVPAVHGVVIVQTPYFSGGGQ